MATNLLEDLSTLFNAGRKRGGKTSQTGYSLMGQGTSREDLLGRFGLPEPPSANSIGAKPPAMNQVAAPAIGAVPPPAVNPGPGSPGMTVSTPRISMTRRAGNVTPTHSGAMDVTGNIGGVGGINPDERYNKGLIEQGARMLDTDYSRSKSGAEYIQNPNWASLEGMYKRELPYTLVNQSSSTSEGVRRPGGGLMSAGASLLRGRALDMSNEAIQKQINEANIRAHQIAAGAAVGAERVAISPGMRELGMIEKHPEWYGITPGAPTPGSGSPAKPGKKSLLGSTLESVRPEDEEYPEDMPITRYW